MKIKINKLKDVNKFDDINVNKKEVIFFNNCFKILKLEFKNAEEMIGFVKEWISKLKDIKLSDYVFKDYNSSFLGSFEINFIDNITDDFKVYIKLNEIIFESDRKIIIKFNNQGIVQFLLSNVNNRDDLIDQLVYEKISS
ncbi:MAG: hypothetical protein ACOCRX_07345 [Candidatus Woesearchaeota archaeon]